MDASRSSREGPYGCDAILLIDHGSVRAEANAMLEEIAALLREEAPEVHVETAHMELASPTIAEGMAACFAAGATRVTVCPYLLAPGRHASNDIPRLARQAAATHPEVELRISAPLGVDRRLAQIIVTRVEEATEQQDPSR